VSETHEVKQAREVKEVEVKERLGNVAAFFDLDGTLTALPSLERRFYRMLRYQQKIPATNYLLWLWESMRLAPRGIAAILQGNKMYLRGVQSFSERDERHDEVSPWHKSGRQGEGQAPVPPRCNSRLPAPAFFADAVERMTWHAKLGHVIVIVSGTLQPLASAAALSLVLRLAVSGVTCSIGACATRLEEMDGQWTGRILGKPMFGKEKAQAVERIASERNLDLRRCYAYGDSADDRWLLEAVGKPVAVNPSRELARVARKRGWPVLQWNKPARSTQRSQSSQSGKVDATGSNRENSLVEQRHGVKKERSLDKTAVRASSLRSLG
jgi:HAD superfamily hydrolase (TIGR01490 family)